ncbi:MAG TPA: DNA repair protein RecO [Ferruginibacter sp.]|nr:DNA repair protein RecO [Ferruginibacter sp.]HMP19733.1 DNA repair protein RecO [Ferruginibacter sp.]
MTHKTKGIVLRTVKYGETSLVVTIFTALFGVQTYLVNGVRSSKNKTSKASYFLPAAILDLVVYHQEQKNMQRIKEFGWAKLYRQVLTNVHKNSVALYMMELLYKCLKQPEQQTDLFDFCEDVLQELDDATSKTTANLPIFFALHLPYFFGFRINDNYSETTPVLDLKEGSFCSGTPQHTQFLEGAEAQITADLLKVMHPTTLEDLHLNQPVRRRLLHHYHVYYSLHIAEFGQMKTLAVLQEVL